MLVRGAGAGDAANQRATALSGELDNQRQISQQALSQVEILNQQIAALRKQIGALEDALNVFESATATSTPRSPISAAASTSRWRNAYRS